MLGEFGFLACICRAALAVSWGPAEEELETIGGKHSKATYTTPPHPVQLSPKHFKAPMEPAASELELSGLYSGEKKNKKTFTVKVLCCSLNKYINLKCQTQNRKCSLLEDYSERPACKQRGGDGGSHWQQRGWK